MEPIKARLVTGVQTRNHFKVSHPPKINFDAMENYTFTFKGQEYNAVSCPLEIFKAKFAASLAADILSQENELDTLSRWFVIEMMRKNEPDEEEETF
jgi:hypothetical protein